jgi:hypothetical protein
VEWSVLCYSQIFSKYQQSALKNVMKIYKKCRLQNYNFGFFMDVKLGVHIEGKTHTGGV